MKFIKTVLILPVMIAAILNSFSTTWTVQVANTQFTPNNLPNVTVGDSIKWQWVNGDHTTTSLTIPGGAAPWDHQITLTSQTFIYVVAVAGNYHYKCTPHFPGMEGDFSASPIGIVPIGGTIPEKFNLSQNYPNPFNPVTNIKIDIAKSSFVTLIVYDILGNEVESLVKQDLNAGSYSVDWNAANYPSGVYVYKITVQQAGSSTGNFTQTRKMILVK